MGATKELYFQIQESICEEIRKAQEGEQYYLQSLVNLERHRKELDQCCELIKEFKSDNLSEIETESKERGSEFDGYKVEVRSGKKTFNYKSISEWVDKKRELEDIELKAKQAYNAKQNNIMSISEDGEILDLPTLSYSKGSIVIKKLK